jgi:hypothetical protein
MCDVDVSLKLWNVVIGLDGSSIDRHDSVITAWNSVRTTVAMK